MRFGGRDPRVDRSDAETDWGGFSRPEQDSDGQGTALPDVPQNRDIVIQNQLAAEQLSQLVAEAFRSVLAEVIDERIRAVLPEIAPQIAQAVVVALNSEFATVRPTNSETVMPSQEESLILSPREREILQCIANGMSDKQIAEELNIGERTVSQHVANLMNKLDVDKRPTAVMQAVRLGILKV